jgi:hypothetical protein
LNVTWLVARSKVIFICLTWMSASGPQVLTPVVWRMSPPKTLAARDERSATVHRYELRLHDGFILEEWWKMLFCVKWHPTGAMKVVQMSVDAKISNPG